MKNVITHIGIEIVAQTADHAYQIAEKFNADRLDNKMKSIIVDEVAHKTYWVTMAEVETIASSCHKQYLLDNGWEMS